MNLITKRKQSSVYEKDSLRERILARLQGYYRAQKCAVKFGATWPQKYDSHVARRGTEFMLQSRKMQSYFCMKEPRSGGRSWNVPAKMLGFSLEMLGITPGEFDNAE